MTDTKTDKDKLRRLVESHQRFSSCPYLKTVTAKEVLSIIDQLSAAEQQIQELKAKVGVNPEPEQVDIVVKLRSGADQLRHEAADEIEKLRSQLNQMAQNYHSACVEGNKHLADNQYLTKVIHEYHKACQQVVASWPPVVDSHSKAINSLKEMLNAGAGE